VRRQPVRIDGEDRVRGLEPRAPERSRVTDRVEVDGQCRRPAHARRRAWATFQSTIPHASPTESMPTSTAEPWRPATHAWWNSSARGYTGPSPSESHERPVARTRSAPSTAYSAVWAILRRTRSQPPRPLDRLGIEENAKITAAQTTTGSQVRANEPVTVR